MYSARLLLSFLYAVRHINIFSAIQTQQQYHSVMCDIIHSINNQAIYFLVARDFYSNGRPVVASSAASFALVFFKSLLCSFRLWLNNHQNPLILRHCITSIYVRYIYVRIVCVTPFGSISNLGRKISNIDLTAYPKYK